jgi:hypothetical protein
LERKSSTLINEDGTINVQKLIKLVKENNGDDNYANFVAHLTNIPRKGLRNIYTHSEMALQQLVFPPISGIMYCFKPDSYVANVSVSCGPFMYTNKHGQQVVLSGVTPDAAVTVTVTKHAVFAHMELKSRIGSVVDECDIFKYVQSTSMSAMGLKKQGFANKITIPFVLNSAETAVVYTTIVEKNSNGLISISVSRFGLFDLTYLKKTRQMCSTFGYPFV